MRPPRIDGPGGFGHHRAALGAPATRGRNRALHRPPDSIARRARGHVLKALMSNPVSHIRGWHAEFTALRRDLHMHPELGFEEHRTARIVAERLAALGIEHHGGIGQTGIVAVIRGRADTSGRAVGLRADMDALPMQEENEFAHKSRYDGRMHGCGHDGHTTMLLAAARYLAETRNFDGTALPDLSAGRGGLRRRQGDDRGRALRALSRGTGLCAAQLARVAARAHRHHARTGDGRGGSHRDHDRRQGRPRRASARGDRSRCWSPPT